MGDDLKQKMLGALTWSSIDRFGQQVVQLIIGIILTRMLTPDDYGLLGMVMIFAALSFVLVESGFGQALIRKENVNELDYNSVFYFNISISIIIYIFLFFLSPFIADFFDQPQLIKINRITFIAILFNALYLIPLSKLGKILDYKTIAKVNLIATISSGILGIIIAFLNYGVWALVVQQVSYHLFRMIFFHLFVKWKPSAKFSFQVIRDFSKYSIHLLSTSLLNVIFNYIFIIILGKFYRKSEVGYYTQGNKLSETFNFTFQSILVGSTFSLFSKIQNDDERFRRVFREIANKISIITFPIVLSLIAVAKPLIEVVWTAVFLPSVPYFQLMCLASLFAPLYTLNISALNARGNSKITFKIEILKKLLIITSLLATFKFGILPMLWAYAISSIISYLISVIYLKKEIKHYIKHQVLDFIKSLGFGLILALIISTFSLFIFNPHLLLLVQFLVATIFFSAIIFLFYNDLYVKMLLFFRSKLTNFFKK